MSEVSSIETKKFGEFTAQAVEISDEETTSTETTSSATTDTPIDMTSSGEVTSSAVSKPKEIKTQSKPETVSVMGNLAENEEIGDSVSFSQKTKEKEEEKTTENKTETLSYAEKKKQEQKRKNADAAMKKAMAAIENLHELDEQKIRNEIILLYEKLEKEPSEDKKADLISDFIMKNNIKLNDEKFRFAISSYLKNSTSKSINVPTGLTIKEEIQEAKNLIKATRTKLGIKAFDKFAFSAVIGCAKSEDMDDEKLAEMLVEFKNELNTAATREEKIEIAKKFFESTRIKIDLVKLDSMLKEYAEKNNINEESAREITKKYSDFRSFSKELALAIAQDNEKTKEAIVEAYVQDVPESEKDLHNVLAEHILENITEDEARAIFAEAGKFTEYQKEDIETTLKEHNFSDSFKEIIKKETTKILENTKKFTKSFIESFFESPKGQAIKSYTQRIVSEAKEAKKEYLKTQEEVLLAQEEAEIAKEESEKAIEAALEEKKKAEAIAADLGYKDLDFDSLYKVLKKESPNKANDLLWAKEKAKTAYWQEWDAKSKERLANSAAKIAEKNLAIAWAKIQAAMIRIQAFVRYSS